MTTTEERVILHASLVQEEITTNISIELLQFVFETIISVSFFSFKQKMKMKKHINFREKERK